MRTYKETFNGSDSFDGINRGGNNKIESLLMRSIEDRVARALGNIE